MISRLFMAMASIVCVVAIALLSAGVARVFPNLEQWPYGWVVIAVPIALAIKMFFRVGRLRDPTCNGRQWRC